MARRIIDRLREDHGFIGGDTIKMDYGTGGLAPKLFGLMHLCMLQDCIILRPTELRSSNRTAGSNPTEGERTIANRYGYAGFLTPCSQSTFSDRTDFGEVRSE
jgi:hypothetical protein